MKIIALAAVVTGLAVMAGSASAQIRHLDPDTGRNCLSAPAIEGAGSAYTKKIVWKNICSFSIRVKIYRSWTAGSDVRYGESTVYVAGGSPSAPGGGSYALSFTNETVDQFEELE